MNKLFFAGVFALGGAAAFAMPGFAQTASSAQSPAATTAQTANGPYAKQKGSVPPLDSRQCIRDTGSHIPPRTGQCLPVAGRSYSAQDIQRTGAINIGQALRTLDPAVTVHGH